MTSEELLPSSSLMIRVDKLESKLKKAVEDIGHGMMIRNLRLTLTRSSEV